MSRKPQPQRDEEKKKRLRKQRSKQTLTRAVAHIRLREANAGKLATLDQLAVVFQALCQQYVTLWCLSEGTPDRYATPVFASPLSERWQRVAMQQAAGIAKSWRTNRQAAFAAYLDDLADYAEVRAKAEESGMPLDPRRREPVWREWQVPELRALCIQANANVVLIEPTADCTFDYWLRISTLDKGHPLRVPVKLAAYHRTALKDKTLNTSTTLSRRNGSWWLTRSCDQDVALQTEKDAPLVGVDVGIATFLTTSSGKQCDRPTFDPPREAGDQSSRHDDDPRSRVSPSHLRGSLSGFHALQGALYECVSLGFASGAHPGADQMGHGQTRHGRPYRESRLFLSGMFTLPVCRSSESTEPADVLLCTLRLPGSR